MTRFFTVLFLISANLLLMAAERVTITVNNPLAVERSNEMVEIDISKLNRLDGTGNGYLVTDSNGNEIVSQITYDGKLIFSVSVGARGKQCFYVTKGTPKPYAPKVYGRQYPERVDDIAWENDLVAFRCYGPALQRSGERAWGYDVLNKRSAELVIEQRYALALDKEVASVCAKLRKAGQGDVADDVSNAVSYHVDHGNGMDCYRVGPTLGCGTDALIVGGEIVYPKCYSSYEILDNGPLRFTVRLEFAPVEIGESEVREVRVISLDAGSQLNKAVVSFEGLAEPMPLAAGLVVHSDNAEAYVADGAKGYIGYEDLGDKQLYSKKYSHQTADFGKIYLGAVCGKGFETAEFRAIGNVGGTSGHVLGINVYQPMALYEYYFGTGWSRNLATTFASLDHWQNYLEQFAERLRKPLKISVK